MLTGLLYIDMAGEKKFQLQTFEEGIDTDTADELLAQNRYRYAQNIEILSASGGKRGIVRNIKGTTEVEFDRPEGLNITIGAEQSPEQNKLFFFEWNENGYHAIYMYDGLLESVVPILINLTDTNDIDILQFKRRSLILHIDIIGDLIYWVDGQAKPRKLNWRKAIDKSTSGYGQTVLQEFVNAYKPQPIFPPSTNYITDTSRLTNYLYGNLFKASCRHIFDDGEISNWSEFSTVSIPQNESFAGNAAVSNINNCLNIAVETGSSDVKQVEIAIKINSLDFVSIITLDKDELNIKDDTLYVYSFYNDSNSFSGLNQQKVQRAYSFMPRTPTVQRFVDRALVYGGGFEGREQIQVDLSVEAEYDDLFLGSGVINELNDPYFEQIDFDNDFTREGNGRRTNSLVTLKIGSDVKAGNFFELIGQNGDGDYIYFSYRATAADDAITVANYFKQRLVGTGRILTTSEDFPTTDIWANTIVGGDVTFSFILRGRFAENATSFTGRVQPISTQTLKDSGQSVSNHKSGGSVKYGLTYWNEDTTRSLTYTSDQAFIRTDFVTETGGYKKVIHNLSIKHIPPVWATFYDVTRTVDLTYGTSWIHILIQKAIESQSTADTEYVDLVVGSLFTYQKMYPNTIVNFNFEKNDRVRFIRKETDGTYYDFIETVVLDYKDIVTEDKSEDITTNETNTVTIGGTTSSDNIGRYISIDGAERLIIAVPSGNTYTLDRIYGTSEKYTSYKIIDRRGIIRVRKPVGVTIEDNSLIEVYKATQNRETAKKQFFIFGHKYAIKDWGTADRSHTGNVQNQDPLNPSFTPAIVSIENGMSYVRQRQLPTNNSIPDTQAIVDLIEDKSLSDFYESDLNDNGKICPQDDGSGEKRFGDRLRFSNNYIEDTRINGLNDFDNTDRKDYNDPYGSFKLLRYKDRLLYAWKDLKTGYIPIRANIIQGDDGSPVALGSSNDLLNQMTYFSHEGGIGNMPMSIASDQNWFWFASPNSGTFCRTGGDGILPISEQFDLDSRLRALLARSDKYGAFVFGGFDREKDEYQPSFEAPKEYLFKGGFDETRFQLYDEDYPEGTEFEVTTDAVNGTVSINADGNFVYTPDLDYVGPDFFFYRWRTPGGEWTAPKKQCLEVVDSNIPELPPIYYNGELIVFIAKEGCEPGYHGSEVEYTVPAFKYSSPFDQAAADQQAADEVEALGQAFADENGTCDLNEADPFAFTDQTDLNINTLVESDVIIPGGSFDSYVISIVGGEYQINGGDWIGAEDPDGLINSLDSVKLRGTTSGSYNTGVNVTLTIGGYSDIWSITTKVAPAVTFGYTLTKDTDPHVDAAVIHAKNGVFRDNIYSNGSGFFADLVAGDSVYAGGAHSVDGNPWPADSSSVIEITKDGVIIYTNTVTDPDLDNLGNDTIILEEGSVYNISIITNSDSTAYSAVAVSIDNQSSVPLSVGLPWETTFRFIDDTDSIFKLYTAQFIQPQLNIGMNWLTGGTGHLIVTNDNSLGISLDYTLSNIPNGGSYSVTKTIAFGASDTFTAIPKTGYTITYTDTIIG